MLTLTKRQQISIGAALVVLMTISRGYHFPTLQNILPSASWAVFFLAGVYLRPAWVFGGLLACAAVIDCVAIGWVGVSDFCVSPAYVALIPAYGALWFAGRWYAGRYDFKASTLLTLAASVLVGTLTCELISSGSFYFFSGRFTDLSIAEFGNRLVKYFPHSLGSMVFWVTAAAIAHTIVFTARSNATKPTLT